MTGDLKSRTKNSAILKPDLISSLAKSCFTDTATKINKDATVLSSVVLNLFIEECIIQASRSARVARDSTSVDVIDLERVIAQVLLDF